MAEQSLKDKAAKGLFWGGVSNGLQQVLGMLFGIFLARILSVDDYGLVGMLAIFVAIANSISESGFTAALTNKNEFKHADYNAVFWFNLIAGSLKAYFSLVSRRTPYCPFLWACGVGRLIQAFFSDDYFGGVRYSP